MTIHSSPQQQSALADLHTTPFIVDAMRAAERFADSVDRFGDGSVAGLLAMVNDPSDTVSGIAAIHALARIFDDSAEIALSDLLSDDRAFVREHAAWAMAQRLPRLDAIARLVGAVRDGGFTGALAQSTLQHWAATAPDHVALTLEGALVAGWGPGAGSASVRGEADADGSRARLAETLGLVSGRVAGRVLVALATDEHEDVTVRCAALAALGDRTTDNAALRTVQRYVDEPGALGDVARLAAYDIELWLNPPERARSTGGHESVDPQRRLTVAQLFLHADIDRELTQSGAGDNGGIATLLVRLGDALVASPQIARVITMSRGSAAAALAALPDAAETGGGASTGFGGGAGGGTSIGAGGAVGTSIGAGAGAGAGAINAQDSSFSIIGSGSSNGTTGSGAGRAQPHHVFAPIPLLAAPLPSARAWPARVAAERGIRRALLALGPVDVLHLRMADVGSLAAATVATRLGIPVVFTLAPDPHAVIHALDMAGTLTRGTFGDADAREHYWYRSHLVAQLAAQADQKVLFPRPDLAGDLEGLLGIDIAADAGRYTVVPEGIDVSVVTEALAEAQYEARGEAPCKAPGESTPAPAPHTELRTGRTGRDAFAALDALLTGLPAARRGLPLAISVGRLHPVKGMATIVESWASDAVLRSTCNLLIVGGDLRDPSTDERGQLDRIEKTLTQHPDARAGLLLAGHRPNDVVARWLAAVRFGRPALSAPGGIYVCGSVKEEFGIALLEAMATGLVVIAPNGGGPATYVADGTTGFLVDTRTTAGVRRGMHDALALAGVNPLLELGTDTARVEQAQALVRDRFTIGAMASALADVYRTAAAQHTPVHTHFSALANGTES
ncbi:MAG: glycosyl transferase group 1 [Subtercola sp.]|nr:glycosyl transferase group 1 [Subtercola sp.]